MSALSTLPGWWVDFGIAFVAALVVSGLLRGWR